MVNKHFATFLIKDETISPQFFWFFKNFVVPLQQILLKT